MIEYGIIVNGKYATVSYLTRDFQPCDKHDADFAEVFYDDGSAIVLCNLRPPEKVPDQFAPGPASLQEPTAGNMG
jgi:hypothetical protein